MTNDNSTGGYFNPDGVYVYACPMPSPHDERTRTWPSNGSDLLPTPDEMRRIAMESAVIADLIERVRKLEDRVLELEKANRDG